MLSYPLHFVNWFIDPQGIHNVFVLSMGLMIAGLIVVFFLKEIPLRGGRSRDAAITEAVEDVSPEGNMAAMI